MASLNTGVPTPLYVGYLPTSTTLLYTVPTAKIVIVTEINLVNRNASTIRPALRFVTAAGSDGNSFAFHESDMATFETVRAACGTVLVAGDKIYGDDGTGGGSDVACRISGMIFDA
jgi:hypothetical protein